MSDRPKQFAAAANQLRITAFWGLEYDTELLSALCAVDDAEAFMKIDFAEIDRRIEAGELTREWWSREAGEVLLQEARESFTAIRSKLETEHGAREANTMIERHFERLEQWRDSKTDAAPEIAVIAILADWLRHADGGSIPSHSRIAAVVESLKAYGAFFCDDTTSEERKRLSAGELLRPIKNIVVWRRERTAITPDAKNWSVIYAEQMERLARLIYDNQLFQGGQVRVDRWLKKTGLPVTPGTDKSRLLFGAVRVKKAPGS